MVPVYYALLDYFYLSIESSLHSFTLYENYTLMLIFGMVVCKFQFSYLLFVFPLIFFYRLVYLWKHVTILFIDTIDSR